MSWAHAECLKLSVADGPGQDELLLGQTVTAVLVLKCSNGRSNNSCREPVSLQLLSKNSSSGNYVVNYVLLSPNNSTAYISTEKHTFLLFNTLIHLKLSFFSV